MTENIEENNSMLTKFLDNIWLQAGVATGITVLWLIWIVYEILIKEAPL